ncbi:MULTISPECIES: hypothetical protein [Kitasatospora]|uniref:hypothetical protein n=1 Tax=Kitasatospora TaxID=2063 RepID=UPI0015F32E7C|nr:hypothetical protein [Kitasatospora xanthocidica]
MKSYRFTCVLSDVEDLGSDPERFINLALRYGDKHQDYFLACVGDIAEEDDHA